MSISWSKEKLAEVLGAKVKDSTESVIFQGAEFDSREIRGGELFLALKGKNTHGHDFVDRALEKGAALCLVEDESFLEHVEHGHRFVCVKNSLEAFWKLANHYRKELAIPILAVTGSMGKTTVKEMTAQLLLTQENGAYSKKSFNNHVGVPYTLCTIGKQHKWAVLEVGMNNPGEISNLTKIIEPNYVLITGIAAVHLAHFENIEAIAKAKCEIFEGLVKDGTVILNADDELLLETYKDTCGDKFSIKTFGKSENSNSRVLNTKSLGLEGVEATIALGDESLEIKIPVPGEHNTINAAAALLAARTFYPDSASKDLIKALNRFVPPLMRLNIIHLKNNKLLVDDSYNANPYSMRVLLELAKQEMSMGRKVGLILGDMRELGDAAEELHAELAKDAAELRPEFLITVGDFAELMCNLVKSAGVKSLSAESPEAAAHAALKLPFDLIMVKASRGVKLDRTVKVIQNLEGLN